MSSQFPFRILPFPLLTALLLPGCVVDRTGESRSFNVMKEIYTNKNMIKILQKRVEKRLGDLEAKTDSMEETYRLSRKNLADSGVLLDNIRSEFFGIKGKMDEILHLLDEMEKKGAGEKEDIEFKIMNINARLSRVEALVGITPEEVPLQGEETPPPPPAGEGEGRSKGEKGAAQTGSTEGKGSKGEGTADGGKPAGEISEEEHFEKGFKLYKEKNYDTAVVILREFIKKFPKSRKADDAQFLLSDSYFQKSEFITAITEFQNLVERYPESGNLSKAILKQGLSFLKLGRKEEAKVFFDDLLNRFPSSEEAKEAKTRLKELK